MYSYKLTSTFKEVIFPDIKIETIKINRHGFGEMLSIDLEANYRLNRAKTSIGKYNSYIWEDVKKNTNPYEYICSCSSSKNNRNHNSNAVALIKPLSRSFFKMIEMINEFYPLLINKNKSVPISTSSSIPTSTPNTTTTQNVNRLVSVHIAEGPGGFIEATRYIRSAESSNVDIAFGMTLVKYEINKNIPGWKQSQDFLNHHPEVQIVTGADKTGDIYQTANIQFLNEVTRNAQKEGAQLITADGGFDFSVDYNLQEQASCKLIYSQILAALRIQAPNGVFICKFFDINLYFTTQMLYLLYLCYKEVIIYKPKTSRIANSEKYIICRGFTGISELYLNKLFGVLDEWNSFEDMTINYIFTSIPDFFITRVRFINREIIQMQINSINNAITLIKTKKYNEPEWQQQNKDKQLSRAKEWCRKYNIPYKQ
jgi:23S rRNA U2552 (ribose-2'-O)-methylase RlmE/FtsJ